MNHWMISNASSLGYLHALSRRGFQRVQKVQHWKHHFSSQKDRQRREDAGSKAKRWLKGKGIASMYLKKIPDSCLIVAFFHIPQNTMVTFLICYLSYLCSDFGRLIGTVGEMDIACTTSVPCIFEITIDNFDLVGLRDYLDIAECCTRQNWHHLYNE